MNEHDYFGESFDHPHDIPDQYADEDDLYLPSGPLPEEDDEDELLAGRSDLVPLERAS